MRRTTAPPIWRIASSNSCSTAACYPDRSIIKRLGEVNGHEHGDRGKTKNARCMLRQLSAHPGAQERQYQIRPRGAAADRDQSDLQSLPDDGAGAEIRRKRDGAGHFSSSQVLWQAVD